jgi:PhnB protein
MKIPQNYLPAMPYIIINNPAGFLEYATKVFGATQQLIIPGEGGRSIMHGELKIHNAVIMFAGATEQWAEKTCSTFIYVDNVDRVFNAAIEQGGTALDKPAQKDYGYSAGFADPFNNLWWITQGE